MNADDVREYVRRRDRALNKMRVISEARGSRPFTPLPGSRSGGGSGPPPGVNLDSIRSQTECPSKDRSLFDFYVWHFSKAKTPEELVTLCFLAERDLDERTHSGIDTVTRDRARNRSILSSRYEDQPPAVVAAVERCSEKHVRTWRKTNGLNATTGRHER